MFRVPAVAEWLRVRTAMSDRRITRCADERPALEAVDTSAHAAACFRSKEAIPP